MVGFANLTCIDILQLCSEGKTGLHRIYVLLLYKNDQIYNKWVLRKNDLFSFCLLGLRKQMLENTTLKYPIYDQEQANADSNVMQAVSVRFLKIHP